MIEIKGVINSLGIKIPISKLFEKSGEGKNKIPLINPIIVLKISCFFKKYSYYKNYKK